METRVATRRDGTGLLSTTPAENGEPSCPVGSDGVPCSRPSGIGWDWLLRRSLLLVTIWSYHARPDPRPGRVRDHQDWHSLRIPLEEESTVANVVVSTHPIVQHKLARLRDSRTPPCDFRQLVRTMAVLLAHEATADLGIVAGEVITPLGRA